MMIDIIRFAQNIARNVQDNDVSLVVIKYEPMAPIQKFAVPDTIYKNDSRKMPAPTRRNTSKRADNNVTQGQMK